MLRTVFVQHAVTQVQQFVAQIQGANAPTTSHVLSKPLMFSWMLKPLSFGVQCMLTMMMMMVMTVVTMEVSMLAAEGESGQAQQALADKDRPQMKGCEVAPTGRNAMILLGTKLFHPGGLSTKRSILQVSCPRNLNNLQQYVF